MRKTTFLLCMTFLLASHLSFAQETVSVNVVYEFKYVRDLANKDMPYTANMILSLGQHSSRYSSEKAYTTYYKNLEWEKKRKEEAAAQSAPSQPMTVVAGNPMLIVNKYGAIINEEVVKDVPGRHLTITGVMGFKTYQAEVALPAIHWNIQTDKKTIGDYTCQKATGSYGGRTYEAWFAPDLPFQDGPWKLSGLPGLILEAQDSKQEVVFVFKSLSRNTDTSVTVQSFLNSPRTIKTTLKDYSRTKEAFETDPEGVMTAMAPNAKLGVRNLDDPKEQHAAKPGKYNPLEYAD